MPSRTIRRIIEQQTPLTTPPDITVAEAAKRMKQARVGALIAVDENGKLTGIFTERDALFRVMAEGLDPTKVLLSQVMTANPQTIGPDRPFAHALHFMYEGGFRHVPVVENGKPLGMISARDALGPELQQFEDELQDRERIGNILA
ncbi:MAG TPA: CBS domain-containing protein [Rhodocyclaceae bacterium]